MICQSRNCNGQRLRSEVMSKAAATLEKFGIDYEMTIIQHTVCRMSFLTGQRQLKERESK